MTDPSDHPRTKHFRMERRPVAPTEPETKELDYLMGWDQFQQYLDFVDWEDCPDSENVHAIVTLSERAPHSYNNKWGRQQWKMTVHQVKRDGTREKRCLSGGNRLWASIKAALIEEHQAPLGTILNIIRAGSGFNTMYYVEILRDGISHQDDDE